MFTETIELSSRSVVKSHTSPEDTGVEMHRYLQDTGVKVYTNPQDTAVNMHTNPWGTVVKMHTHPEGTGLKVKDLTMLINNFTFTIELGETVSGNVSMGSPHVFTQISILTCVL